MFSKQATKSADFHNKKCYELMQKIAASVPADKVLDSEIYTVGFEKNLEFLKNLRDFFKTASYQEATNYHEILREFLLKMEIRLNKYDEFCRLLAVKKIVNVLFDQHSTKASEAIPVRELMMGTLAQRHGKYEGVSPLFLAWIDYNATPTPTPAEQIKIRTGKKKFTPLLLNFNILPVEGDDDPAFKKLMGEIKEQYDYSQVIGIMMPHDLLLKHSDAFKKATAFTHDQLVALIATLITEKDGAFFLQGGIAMLISEAQIAKLVEKSLMRLGVDTQTGFGKDEALAVYFHLIKYEMPQALIEKYQPEYITFTTSDRLDRGNIASAYHALVQSIEHGEPLNRTGFNAVLFAPEHEQRRVRQDQKAILWKAMNTYVYGLKLRGMDVPEWIPRWLEKHTPEHGRDWYVKKLDELIKAEMDKTTTVDSVVAARKDKMHGKDMTLFDAMVDNGKNRIYCATILKGILSDPHHTKGLLTEDDLRLIDRDAELKALCEEMKKDHIINFDVQTRRNVGKSRI